MNIRLVGVSYRLPRLDGVSYRLPRVTDVELWENHRLYTLKDTAVAVDALRIYADVGVKDSAVAFSECLIARPPFEEVVVAVETLTFATQYNRTFRDSIVPNSSCVFGMDKYLKDVVVAGDSVRMEFSKLNSDFVAVYDNLDLFAATYLDFNEAIVASDDLRFDVDKNIDEVVTAVESLYKQFDDGGFVDSNASVDSFAFELTKRFVDSVSISDFIQVLWSRSTGSLYGQSVYGGATFGG